MLRGKLGSGEEVGLELMDDYVVRTLVLRPFGFIINLKVQKVYTNWIALDFPLPGHDFPCRGPKILGFLWSDAVYTSLGCSDL